MRYLLYFVSILLFASSAQAQIAKRTGKMFYSRSTVGTTAQDVIAAANVQKKTYGWLVCHDPGSTATYVDVSENADPATDGLRLGPGQCFDCDDCGEGVLRRLRIKAQAAGAGYSVVQKTP